MQNEKWVVDISKGIQVGGFLFEVDLSEKAHRSLVADNDSGQCDCRNKVIMVDYAECPQQVSKTFIHEVVEAVNHVFCADKIEHERIQQLSFGLHQVMESLGVRFGAPKPTSS